MNFFSIARTASNGFIARPKGDLSFLPPGGGEPHGYNKFIISVDALVIGRKSLKKVLTFEAWPYDDKRVVVLSSRPVDLSAAGGGVVEQMAGLRLRSFRNSLLVPPTTSTSTEGSRFKGSCERGSFNVSLSLGSLWSSETESLSSVP
jgi:hypothetical protein